MNTEQNLNEAPDDDSPIGPDAFDLELTGMMPIPFEPDYHYVFHTTCGAPYTLLALVNPAHRQRQGR